jgi:hypothetical protein
MMTMPEKHEHIEQKRGHKRQKKLELSYTSERGKEKPK